VSEYLRGVEDALEGILVMMSTCKNIDDLREKIEQLLRDLIEGKTERLIVMLSRKGR